jgi:hypothetical protein
VAVPPFIGAIGFGMLLTRGVPTAPQITGFVRGVTVGADAFSIFGGSGIYSPLTNTIAEEFGVASGLNVGFNVSFTCLMSDPITALRIGFFHQLVC